jgi:hypothetical protein
MAVAASGSPERTGFTHCFNEALHTGFSPDLYLELVAISTLKKNVTHATLYIDNSRSTPR